MANTKATRPATEYLPASEVAAYRHVISAQRADHGDRVAARSAINGQPNGYKPVTEAELQAEKALALEVEALEGDETRHAALIAARAA